LGKKGGWPDQWKLTGNRINTNIKKRMKQIVIKHEDFRKLSDEKLIRYNKSSDIFDDKTSNTSSVSKLNRTVNNVLSRRDFCSAIKLTTLCLSLRMDDVLYDVLRQTASADYPKK
jgi:hypothetical protein